MNEVVSIITPSFNRAKLVTETAESIFAQTYPHWEWMIVDDGSTDNSWEVLQTFAQKDSRVKIFKRDRGPKGACACRNIAIEKSTGTYLIFLDTDDILAPFCLEQRVKAMQEQPACDFIIFPMLLFKKQLDDVNRLWNVDKNIDELMRMLINDPICQGTGTLWRKKIFEDIGMWREDLRIWQDVELHIRSFLWPLKHAKRMDLPPDVYLRISDDSLSRIGYYDLAKFKSRIEVFRYACQSLLQKNLMNTYKVGIRTMGLELILGIIFGRHFKAAKEAISLAAEYGLYNRKELLQLKIFLYMQMFKLSKLKPLDKRLFKSIRQIVPDANDTVGVISYGSKPIQKKAGNSPDINSLSLNLMG